MTKQSLQDQLTQVLVERDQERAAKDQAYHERDQLVALLANLFPSSLERHPDADTTWEEDWRWLVFVDLPTGQCSWHIHDSELPWFDHVPGPSGWEWDGHTTKEKYTRIRQYVTQNRVTKMVLPYFSQQTPVRELAQRLDLSPTETVRTAIRMVEDLMEEDLYSPAEILNGYYWHCDEGDAGENL